MSACGCSRKIVDQIKVIARVEGMEADNALTLNPLVGKLQFGGPLVHDTVVNGNHKLSFGSIGSSINYFSVSSGTTVYLEANNGTVGSFVNLANNLILIGSSSPSSGGLMGLHNYSPNYTDGRYYVQKMYVDNVIAGRPATNAVTMPGPTEHGKVISWNQPTQQWTLTAPGAAPTAGDNTQVIFNQAGALVGHPNFTFSTGTNFLSTPNIFLGHPLLAGNLRFITAQSDVPDTSIAILPKGAGYVQLATYTGVVFIGRSDSPNDTQGIRVESASSNAHLALEPKGTDGVVFIGNGSEGGGFRYLYARGVNPEIDFVLGAKGNFGRIILHSSPNDQAAGDVVIGAGDNVSISGVSTKRLYTSSNYTRTDLQVGGRGIDSVVHIGTTQEAAPTRFLVPGSSSPDANLFIRGKGAGLAALNGFVFYRKIAIGDWNMDAFANTSIPHTIDYKKIVSVVAVIRDDFDATYRPLTTVTGGTADGWVVSWTSGLVVLERRTSGFFDTGQYDATGYNRGWIYIVYEL